MEKALIYRPLGNFPPKTMMGELEIGKVHSVPADQVERYAKKGFTVLTHEDAALVRAGKPIPAALTEPAPKPRAQREKKTTDSPASEGGK